MTSNLKYMVIGGINILDKKDQFSLKLSLLYFFGY